ncbi:MAG: DUF1800 family protein [Hyphomicrobiaceae bacterium]
MSTRDAAVATRRFGLGARPGENARIAGDPHGFLLAQIDGPTAAGPTSPLRTGEAILASFQQARLERREARQSTAAGAAATGPPQPATSPPAGAPRASTSAAVPGASESRMPVPPARLLREAYTQDIAARIVHAATTDRPLVERLVMFWSSHFAVSAAKGAVRGLAGAFEREAIRPHVTGRFADMLLAVAKHPAMLIYLDNAQSIGPGSTVGKRRTRGLNENLAREILELHTLGVDGGYSQADVTALARLLTGWSIGVPALPATVPGRFYFAAQRHEPGGATVLGKRYVQGGIAEGEAALADLARHPATARHVARKLARHFVADAAPPALVARLEQTFRRTDGDLAAVARALVETPDAWAPAPVKILPPYDYLVSLVRGFAPLEPPLLIHRFATALGQQTWTPPSPKGWPDDDDAWTSPAAIRERLRIVEVAAAKSAAGADPRLLAEDLLGGLLGEATRSHVARAETREQGLELLAMSPEFLRR